MAFRRGTIHWYDVILLGLAAAIVYPDRVVDWLSERMGRPLGWLHLILVEAVAITLMVCAMVLLMPLYPRLAWWYPLWYVGFLAILRVVMALVVSLFGFDD